jgi:hypothetical protein
MSAFHPKGNAAAHTPDATVPEKAGTSDGSTPIALQDRLAELELKRLDLQRIICELLAKNEELRSRISHETQRRSQTS